MQMYLLAIKQQTRFSEWGSVLAACALLTIGGCGDDGVERIELSGSVTFQGQPVEDGQIRFIPQPGTAAPLTIEPIRGGQYDSSISGGVPVGSHRIEIRAFDPNQPAPQGPGDAQRTQLLPPKYNTESELEITLEAGQGTLEKDFEL